MAPASPFTAAAIVLGAIAVVAGSIIPPSETMRCHVCGNGSAVTAAPGQAALPARECRPDQPDERDCPPGYRGCLTAYDGRTLTLTRTCEERALEDPCTTANGVVYCYCSHGSLCNSQSEDSMRQQLAAALAANTADRGDDGRRRGSCEDDEECGREGSGDSTFEDFDEASTRAEDVPVHKSPAATSSAASGPSTPSSPSSSTGRTTAADDDDFYIKGGSRSSESTEAAGDGAATAATTAAPATGKGGAGHARGSWCSWTLAAACVLPLLQLR